MKIIITGAAGFIGSRLCETLALEGAHILGIDNFSPYYSPGLKTDRLRRAGFDIPDSAIPSHLLHSHIFPTLSFINTDIDSGLLATLAADFKPDILVHLAAIPGVRHSTSNPEESLKANTLSFLSILNLCRDIKIPHLIYASSSSVYGNATDHPMRETDATDHPLSVYAVSKRSDEMLADVYSRMYGFAATGLRFFSVYGEWGRPDMAPVIFSRALLRGEPLDLFNGGRHMRDFTYIDDVAECIRRIVFQGGGRDAQPGHEIFNIGGGQPTSVSDMVSILERYLGAAVSKTTMPRQPGEASITIADPAKLKMHYGYVPSTPLEKGLEKLAKWVKEYYGVCSKEPATKR